MGDPGEPGDVVDRDVLVVAGEELLEGDLEELLTPPAGSIGLSAAPSQVSASLQPGIGVRWCRADGGDRTQGVVKTFGPIRAVDGLDLSVPEGVCLGLLGPNGAGKSTTMRLLTGQAIADSGSLRVLGYELPSESKEARAEMGVVPQLDNLDIDVTVEDNLKVFARLYRVADIATAVDRALDARPAAATGAATPSTSSPAACAAACSSPAASSTSPG